MVGIYSKHKKKTIWGILFFLFFFFLVFILRGRKEEQKSHILVIHSYNENCGWKDELNKGIEECLSDHHISAQVRTFYLDSEKLRAQQELDTLTNLLGQYKNSPLDLIVVCDDQATFSLLETKHPLTYKVPVVFCGVDYVNQKLLGRHTNVTGFTASPDFVKCYELGRRLFGTIKMIGIIAEENYLGKTGVSEILNQCAQMPEITTITERTEKSFVVKTDTIHPLQNGMPPVGILIERLDMQNGRELKTALFLKVYTFCLLAKWSMLYSPIVRMGLTPFLMMNNEGFGDGYLGGYMTPSYDQTYHAMEVGIKVLKGTPVADIPVTASKQYPVFDWEQLQYWNISLDKLPEGSIIPNMPFWEKNKTLIFSYGFILSSFVLLVIIFLIRLYIQEAKNKKQAQAYLLKEQEDLNMIIESLDEGVVSVDVDGVIITINRAAVKWLQLSQDPSVYIGQIIWTLFDIQKKDDSYYLRNILTEMAKTLENYKLEETACVVTADKKVFPVSGNVSSIRNNDDEFCGVVITFRDITDEYTSKEFLALNMVAGDIFAWHYDETKHCIIYDKAYFSHFGIPDDGTHSITQEKYKKAIHPSDLKHWNKAINNLMTGKITKMTLQKRMNMSGSGYEWWEYRVASMPGSSLEKQYRLFGLCLNIERFKKAEAELIRVRDEALESDRMKGLFLANMSHEIRTPLNSIVGFSSLLIQNEDLSAEERRDFIEIINTNCQLLLKLINEILDISRIESGISFRQEECDLSVILDEITAIYQASCPEAVHLITQYPEKPLSLIGDPFRLKQLVGNLVNNAIKFTKKGVIIVGYTLNEESNKVTLFVNDTGIGISREECEKIFERFYKSDNFIQGGGLGLPICLEIVKRMGGTIHVESEVQKGTCFVVHLPYDKEKYD